MKLSFKNVKKSADSVSSPISAGCVFDLDKIFLNVKSPNLLVRNGKILNSEAFVRVSVGD